MYIYMIYVSLWTIRQIVIYKWRDTMYFLYAAGVQRGDRRPQLRHRLNGRGATTGAAVEGDAPGGRWDRHGATGWDEDFHGNPS